MNTYRQRNPSIHLRILLLLTLIIWVGLTSPRYGLAAEATIKDFFVNNSDTHILLYLTVINCFTEEMETGIENGIPATFTYTIELYQKRNNWPDKKIISHVLHRTLAYDNLKEEYAIVSSANNTTITTPSLNQAKGLMTEISGFPVVGISRLQRNTTYKLRVKVKLAKKTLPLYFHYLIPFSSLWDFDTNWHTIEFRF
jgi:hypothetical protein